MFSLGIQILLLSCVLVLSRSSIATPLLSTLAGHAVPLARRSLHQKAPDAIHGANIRIFDSAFVVRLSSTSAISRCSTLSRNKSWTTSLSNTHKLVNFFRASDLIQSRTSQDTSQRPLMIPMTQCLSITRPTMFPPRTLS